MEQQPNRSIISMKVRQKPCEHCKEVFTPIRATKRYCSDRCRYLAFMSKAEEVVPIEETKQEVLVNPASNAIQTLTNDTVVQLGDESLLRMLPVIVQREKFKYRSSVLISRLKEAVNKNNISLLVLHRRSASNASENVRWVTTYLASLLEALLKLSYQSQVPVESVKLLVCAFKQTLSHKNCSALPNSYPYIDEMLSWTSLLSELIAEKEDNDRIRFRISLKQKLRVLTVAHEIRQAGFQTLRFSELQF